jgi:hypothetical protein
MQLCPIRLPILEDTVCDETFDPLLDRGLVEVSGSFALLTFAFEKIRADSSS